MCASPDDGVQAPPYLRELAKTLVSLGCPAEKAGEMASQLDKRARQLCIPKAGSADQRVRTHAEAIEHLIGLMRQGWAAQKKDLN